MPIETTCHACGKLLRVADEHAGKVARCPACQTVYSVPGRDDPSASSAAATPERADRWFMKTADGLQYGPVDRKELDSWQREGRITAQAQLLREADGRWIWAGQVYPQLHSLASDGPSQLAEEAPSQDPYAPPSYSYGSGPSYLEPHRGAAILALAIVGVCACNVLSIVAVVMAAIDLNKMKRGTMDPSGRGLTVAGLVIALLTLAGVATYLVGAFVANFQ